MNEVAWVAPKHKEVVTVDRIGSKQHRVLQKKRGRDARRAHEHQENTGDRQSEGSQTLTRAGKRSPFPPDQEPCPPIVEALRKYGGHNQYAAGYDEVDPKKHWHVVCR